MIVLYLIIVGIMSIITYTLYAIDKKRAIRGINPRISEKRLLLHSFFFGALGGLIAMYTLRHKTKREHWYFTFINILSLIIHISLAILIIKKIGFTQLNDIFGKLNK